MPDDRTIVVERFRDEIGDWRVAVLSPFGGQVHAPWALARRGPHARALRHRRPGHARRRRHRVPPARPRARRRRSPRIGRSCSTRTLDPDEVDDLVTERDRRLRAVRRRASASARPAPCCCPAAAPTGASRCGSSASAPPQLLEVASQYPTFPIVLEAVRECVQDVFDVPGPRRPDARHRARAGSRSSTSRSTPAVAVRQVAAVRLRRAVPLRGRLARSPSAGPPRWPSTRACSPSCSARARGWRCATCSTPSRGPHRGRAPAAHARARRPATPRTSPTCSACSARCRSTTSWPVPRGHRPATPSRPGSPGSTAPAGSSRCGVAGDDRWAAIEDAARLRDALGRVAAARACRRPSSSRCRPARRPRRAATPAPTGRSTPPRSRRACGRRSGGRPRRPAPARLRRTGRRGRAAAHRERRWPRSRVLRRRGAAPAAPSVARRAARTRSSRSPSPTSPASCRSGRASAEGCGA